MAPSPVSKEIRPAWTAGQKWKVEYERTVVSKAMRPVTGHPPPERSVWIYEVEKPSSEREPPTVIAIREEGGNRRYEMRFDPVDLSLRSASEVVGPSREKVGEVAPHQPYFGWSQSQPCIFDWPLFSKAGLPAKLPFRGESGDPAEQRAEQAKDGTVVVTFTATSAEDDETTRSIQSWEPGQPWWKSALVEVEYPGNGKRDTVVQIRGRRLP